MRIAILISNKNLSLQKECTTEQKFGLDFLYAQKLYIFNFYIHIN